MLVIETLQSKLGHINMELKSGLRNRAVVQERLDNIDNTLEYLKGQKAELERAITIIEREQ